MKRLLIALMFVISLVSFSTMTNQSVKSIEVVNNNQVPASLIKNALKGTGYFEDVMLQPISYDGGVKIVVDVIEKQNVASLLKERGVSVNTVREDTDKSVVISSIKFNGNKKYSAAELQKITQLKTGEYFSRSRVEEAQRNLLATGKFAEVRPDAKVTNGKFCSKKCSYNWE